MCLKTMHQSAMARTFLLLMVVFATSAALTNAFEQAEVDAHIDCLNTMYHFAIETEQSVCSKVRRKILPSHIKIEKVIYSEGGQDLPLTIATSASMEQLNSLRRLCQSWPGPLVAAVHHSFIQSQGDELDSRNESGLQYLIEVLEAYAASLSAPSDCSLRLVLAWDVSGQEASTSSVYPINSMRNIALSMVRTCFVQREKAKQPSVYCDCSYLQQPALRPVKSLRNLHVSFLQLY